MTETVEWCTVVWQVADATASTDGAGWTTFGVAALTGAIGVIGILLGQKNQARSESKSVRAALITEVKTIRRQLGDWGYLDTLRAYAKELAPTQYRFKKETRTFRVSTAECINKVYVANLGRLGGLSEDEAFSIVRFHYMLEGFVLAISEGGSLAEGAGYRTYEEAVRLLEDLFSLADDLTVKTTPWWRRCGQFVDAGRVGKKTQERA